MPVLYQTRKSLLIQLYHNYYMLSASVEGFLFRSPSRWPFSFKGVSMTLTNPELTFTFLGGDVEPSTLEVVSSCILKESVSSTFQLFSSLKSSSHQMSLSLRRTDSGYRIHHQTEEVSSQCLMTALLPSSPAVFQQTTPGLSESTGKRLHRLRLRTWGQTSRERIHQVGMKRKGTGRESLRLHHRTYGQKHRYIEDGKQ